MIDLPVTEPIPVNQTIVYHQSNKDLINKKIKGYRGRIDQWHPLMAIKLENIEPFEVIIVSGSVEVTNDTGRNYSIVSRIVINNNYNDMPGKNGAIAIGGGGGGNVNNQRHHEQLYKMAVWVPRQSYKYKYVTYMGRAVSSAWKEGDEFDFTQAAADYTIIRFQFR